LMFQYHYIREMEQIRLTPRLCRAARSLLGWQQQHLVDASGVAKSTVGAFEIKGEAAKLANLNNQALVHAFEKAGLQFILENGGGAGVRWKDRQTAIDEGRSPDELTSENDG
jgi:transcriptional regulator with XRE-family HTH domain